MKKLSLLMTLLFAGQTYATPIQWTSAMGGNDHWYEFISTTTNEFDARSNALSSTHNDGSGYLVTITSMAEQNFVKNLPGLGNTRAWIGASDAASEGNWAWMDGPEAGQALVFDYWAPGEPNDHSIGEDYASLNWNSSGQWNDWGTPAYTVNIGSIVEYNNSSANIPEPTSLALLGLGLVGFGLSRRKKTT